MMNNSNEIMTPHKRRALYDAERRKSQSARPVSSLTSTPAATSTTPSRLPSPIKSLKNSGTSAIKPTFQIFTQIGSSNSYNANSDRPFKSGSEATQVDPNSRKTTDNDVEDYDDDLLSGNADINATSSPVQDSLLISSEGHHTQDSFITNENSLTRPVRKNSVLVSDSEEPVINGSAVSVQRSNTTGSLRVAPVRRQHAQNAQHVLQQRATTATRMDTISPVGVKEKKQISSYSSSTTSSIQNKVTTQDGDKTVSSSSSMTSSTSLSATELDKVKARYITEVHGLKAKVSGQDTEIAGLKRCLQECETKLAAQDRVFYDGKIALVMEELHARYNEKHTRKIADMKQNLALEWQEKFTLLENKLQSSNTELRDLKQRYAAMQSELKKERKEKSDMVKLWDEYQQLETTNPCEEVE